MAVLILYYDHDPTRLPLTRIMARSDRNLEKYWLLIMARNFTRVPQLNKNIKDIKARQKLFNRSETRPFTFLRILIVKNHFTKFDYDQLPKICSIGTIIHLWLAINMFPHFTFSELPSINICEINWLLK